MRANHQTSPSGVTVVMAIDRDGPSLVGALRSIEAQKLRNHDLLLVLNGADRHEVERSCNAAAVSRETRIIKAPGANLAAAMNLALREATHEFVARMDADDLSKPGRLAAQVDFLRQHPAIAAVGTSFDRIDADGALMETCCPPTDPREIRWRLLVENCVAHGSVMMRRHAILDAGGYDESCDRAQDYELWLRLAARGPCIANLPEVLYQYRCGPAHHGGSGWRSSPEQATVASAALLRAWSALPATPDDAALHEAIASVLTGDDRGHRMIEQLLTERGPTRERLQALLWARALHTPHPTNAIEAGRASLLRDLSDRLRAAGADRLWLWGAGRHTEWLLSHLDLLDAEIVGIVDDHRAGETLHGMRTQHPSSLRAGDHVVLSSDTHEDAMWASSAPARARGVIVWRLYGKPAPLRAEAAV